MRVTRGQLIAGIGLFASCIAIFTFFTGISSITQINLASGQPIVISSVETPTIQFVPTKTPIPGSTSFLVTAGGQAFAKNNLCMFRAQRDAANAWVIERGSDAKVIWADANYLLSPGDYAVSYCRGPLSSVDFVPTIVGGSWGIPGFDEDGEATELLPFSVSQGVAQTVRIPLAKVRIALISASSGAAIRGQYVWAYCQSKTDANMMTSIPTHRCRLVQKTNNLGIAIFYIGAGKYSFAVQKIGSEEEPVKTEQIAVFSSDVSIMADNDKSMVYKIKE